MARGRSTRTTRRLSVVKGPERLAGWPGVSARDNNSSGWMTRRHPVSKNAVAAVCPAPVLPFNAGKREIRAIIKKIKEGKRWTIQRIEHRPAKLVTISPRTIRRYHFFEENLFQSESSKDPYVRAFTFNEGYETNAPQTFEGIQERRI